MSLRTNTGRHLNELWKVGAKHALYHKDGLWYERLEAFPGAYFDQKGYVLFETESAFLECTNLRVTKKVWVPHGIATIPTYRAMHGSAPDTDPVIEHVDMGETFQEGRTVLTLHRRKERNRKAVRRKKEIVIAHSGRLVCEVCGFDFAKIYGQLGVDFAECHHCVPLASLEACHQIRLSDFAIVCANCHRMLHRSVPMLTVSDLREIVLGRRSKS